VSAGIAESYRRLAIKFHPDKDPGNEEAAARFEGAARAYEVLSDADMRARYDRFGHAGVQGGPRHDFDDICRHLRGVRRALRRGHFGDAFGGGRRRGSRARKGRDVFCTVKLSLVEAARGTTQSVAFTRHERAAPATAAVRRRARRRSPANTATAMGR